MSTVRLVQALFFLQSRSIANSLKVRIRRLGHPRYLVGAIVGLGYLYFWLGHAVLGNWRNRGAAPDLSPSALESFQAMAALVLLGVVFVQWLFPGDRAALQFSEAELAFLLPAPLSRRLLVRYKLIRGQLGTLVSAGLLTVFTGRFATDGRVVYHVVGWWIILTLLSLHAVGASFTVQRLTEHGLSSWLRRLAGIAAAGVVLGLALFWVRSIPSLPVLPGNAEAATLELGEWFDRAHQSGPGRWILVPFRWAVHPWFARSASEFLLSLGPPSLLMLLLFRWVERCDVSFEEASVDLAEKRALMVSRVREGKPLGMEPPRAALPAPFTLASIGPPATALVWKNLIASRATPRKLAAITAALAVSLAVVKVSGSLKAQLITCFLSVLTFVALTIIAGSQCSGALRRDLAAMDVLKGYPVPGWKIVLGELLGPAVVWYCLQVLSVIAGLILRPPEEITPMFPGAAVLAAGISALLVVAPLNLVNALTPAAATLLFPAWSRPGRDIQQPGFEAMGQRILFGLGQLLAMALSLAPAILVAGAGFLAARWIAGLEVALLVAGGIAAVLLAAEAYLVIRLLGQLFDLYDASAEI